MYQEKFQENRKRNVSVSLVYKTFLENNQKRKASLPRENQFISRTEIN
jgi:hypothetical protein